MKKGYIENIESLSIENIAYRKVIYTDSNCQLVIMSLLPGEEIGEEVHNVDQLLRIERGTGEAVISEVTQSIADGSIIIVPSGTKHNIINTGLLPMKLYTLYSPPHHRDQVIHQTKEESESDTEHYDGKTTE